ncbi:MAG TPA: PD-(D/E)XK nuclease family protein, partial [bacterium]|nr:PD-(D/E)XK nuclease family protein [bacterium]
PCAPEKQTLASDYYQSKKKNFSLTELEKYAECPYCYYAACHLKLDRPPVDELEPSADVKGSFVHQVLFRLIAENETLYWEGLEYASYREKLVKKLGHVIQEEIDKSEEFKKYHQKMIEFYAYRVYKTISTLLQLESENYKTAKKKTVPRHYEWSFGSDSRKPLVLDTKAGVVQIRGRVDRVDVCQASRQFSVVDYKTGQAPSLTAIKAVKSLQLPAYLIAVQQLLYPDQAPAGAYYYLLKTNEIKGFSMRETVDAGLMHKRSQLGLVEWQDLQDRFVLRLGEIVEGVRAGHFDPNPASAQLCRFCDYKYLCGYRATECEPEDDE